jgi:hypothetical protein
MMVSEEKGQERDKRVEKGGEEKKKVTSGIEFSEPWGLH